MTSLRAMRWPDIPAVHRIEVAAFPETAWSVETFWAELAGVPESRWYGVADIDGDVVGYAGLMTVGAQGDVQTIAVDAANRGQGIGRLLLDAVIEESRNRGCTSLLLEVAADNTGARTLYRRRGFEQLAVRAGYFGPGRDAVVMRLPLRRRSSAS